MSSLSVSEHEHCVNRLVCLGERILCQEERGIYDRESLQWTLETETMAPRGMIEDALDVLLGEIEDEEEENGQDIQGNETLQEEQGGKSGQGKKE